MSDAALRGRPAVPHRDPVGRRAARARGRARRGRAALRARAPGLAGERRDDADRRRDPRDGATGRGRGRRGVALPRPARRLGHGRPVARDGGRRRRRPRRCRDRGCRSPRCGAASRSASARSSSPTSACCRRSARCGEQASCRRRSCSRPRSSCRARTRRPRERSRQLGATTINVSTDLSPAELGELRAACSAPLDVYVEVPDDQGGFVRFYDVPEIVRLAAPVYVKLGLRNAPNIYPSGLHLEDLAVKLGRERVRRAELVLRLLEERGARARRGTRRRPPADLGIPEP